MSATDDDMPGRLVVLVAAYDAGLHTSEGYVARSVLRRLNGQAKVILVTRRNNVAVLQKDADFRRNFGHVTLIGFDLPKWAAWWKRGARFYELYAYLWQVVWPFVIRRKHKLVRRIDVVHTLNFHNDSMPAMGWILRRPSVWGPINHNEAVPAWRTATWPRRNRIRQSLKGFVRRIGWRTDPLLKLCVKRTNVVFSGGSWVDQRLSLTSHPGRKRRSQLGVDDDVRPLDRSTPYNGIRLVSAGRLDWIKGLELAISALRHLPDNARLTIIGNGPCGEFLVQHAIREGVADRVEFVKWMDRRELLQSYSNYDVFLFASAEAGGLSWVEALATGLPVVGFTGPSELSDRAGCQAGIYLADDSQERETNIKRFAAKVEAAVDDRPPAHELSRAVHDRYGWDALAEDVAASYREVASSPQ